MVRASRARARDTASTSQPLAFLLHYCIAWALTQSPSIPAIPPTLAACTLSPSIIHQHMHRSSFINTCTAPHSPTHALLLCHACARRYPASFAPPPVLLRTLPFSLHFHVAPHLPSAPSAAPLTHRPPSPRSRRQHRQLDAQQVQHLELHRLALSSCSKPVAPPPPKTCKRPTPCPCAHAPMLLLFRVRRPAVALVPPPPPRNCDELKTKHVAPARLAAGSCAQ